ncbi:hypothetical protein [Acaryochloris marina]|uniref:hypothetical protein n=1 Tax=Acaryochloris marina TaxID=155978 RepID=UPI001BAF3B2E|nr:hypothetical protein [Acaryochloris marina]QUY45611.1 hypothetical protein I1H34_28090 [Acaryochloris marina S15]
MYPFPQRLKKPLLIVILWVSVNPPIHAQSFTQPDYDYSSVISNTASQPGDSPYNVGDIYSSSDKGNGQPKGLLDRILSKKAQKSLFKVIEHGSKALKAAKIGRNVYRAVTGKRLQPALKGVTDILVLYGIIDPPQTTAQGGSSTDGRPIYKGPSYEDNPSRLDIEPNSPREVYAIARNVRAIGEEFHEKLTQIVLSDEGQELIQAEEATAALAQEEAIAAQDSITEIVGVSEEQASANVSAAEEIQVLGAEAQGDKSSQSILKRLSLQQAFSSSIGAQTSQQLTGLTAASAHQNRSLGAIASQNLVQTRKLSKLELLQASGNQQRTQTNFMLEALKNGEDLKQDIQVASTKYSFFTPQIPGLGEPESK